MNGLTERKSGFDAIPAVSDLPSEDTDCRGRREDVYRKHIFKRVGLRLEKFVQPNRTEEELYNNDIPVGPEMRD
uniref:Uncharacterized protein n=1 Tax=Ditylenchus dipsaci TaxID=166011 RepID=A0A915CX16_9BILA